MFYWTRGNESVSGLDTLQLAQYTVEDHYTSVSEAVYETGRVQSLLPDCASLFRPCFDESQTTSFSKAITPSLSSILSWRGAFSTLSWRHMSPPACLLSSPGFPSGSRCPLSQHGFASVWTNKPCVQSWHEFGFWTRLQFCDWFLLVDVAFHFWNQSSVFVHPFVKTGAGKRSKYKFSSFLCMFVFKSARLHFVLHQQWMRSLKCRSGVTDMMPISIKLPSRTTISRLWACSENSTTLSKYFFILLQFLYNHIYIYMDLKMTTS